MKLAIAKDGFEYDLDQALKKGNFFEKVFHRSRLRFWLSAIDYTGKKVLDVGCNTGILLIPFLKRGIDIVGVDIAEGDVAKAKEKLRKEGFLPERAGVSDAKKLTFKSGFFDIVILSDVLEHLTKPELAAQEALRVTKKGGLVLVTVPNEWHPVVKFAWVRKALSGRKNVEEHPDMPFNFHKLIRLFPRTRVVKQKLIGFWSEIYCMFMKT